MTERESEDQRENDSLADQRDPEAVRDVYDEIASHFSETRAYPWPEVEAFLDDISRDRGSIGLDLGCGNGRHAAILGERVGQVLALDVSRALLFEARDRLGDDWPGTLIQADAAEIPVATDTVDVAVYIATVHHLPDRETRVRSLGELARVLTDGGKALVSAWSTAHDRFDAYDGTETEGFDTTIDWTLPGGERRERYYHIYAPAEFEEDVRESGLVVEESYVSSGNCYAEVRT